MKTIKLLLLLVLTSTIFYSCSDNDPIENQGDTQSSIALRTTLEEIKKANGIAGRMTNDSIFCFEFVYPITFSFNSGTVVTVTSFDGLVDILSSESPQLYLDSVVFPFQVMQQSGTGPVAVTINSESDFVNLLQSCGFDTIDDDVVNSFCFDVVFPITVGTAAGNIEISNIQEFQAYLDSLSAISSPDIVFPISVLFEGQVVAVNNIYDFYQMIGNCDDCICTQEAMPVCVQTANGVLEYGNSCYAICAGYTQSDFVDCNQSPSCSITELTAVPGECNTDGTYQLTLNFTYSNPVNSQFEVRSNGHFLIATYDLSDLPLTINNYPDNGQQPDSLYVNIVGDFSCVAVKKWSMDCGSTCEQACPANANPVCVMTTLGPQQFINECFAFCAGFTAADFITCGVAANAFGNNLGSCFTISYPVMIQHQGALVTVDSDSEVLQFYFPASSPIPAFNYPITTSFNGVQVTIATQMEFEIYIENACN